MAIAPETPANEPAPAPDPAAPAAGPAQPAVDRPAAEPDIVTERAATAAAVAAVVSADPNLVSTTVALPTDALEFLRSESIKNGTSTGDELRRSIGTQKFLRDKLAEGATLQLRDAKGNLFDVTI